MSRLAPFLLFAAGFLADALSKEWALRTLPPPMLHAGSEFFALALHFNRGTAFSLLRSVPGAALLLSIVGLFLLFAMHRALPSFRRSPAWGLLFAGAAGNMADRLLHGYVVDWFRTGPLHMNAADVLLCVGGALLMLEMLRK